MKIAIASLMAISAACLSVPSLTGGSASQEAQQGPDDANKIYDMIKQSRADLREMRVAAGLHAHPAGPHIDPEGHHANDTPEQQARERGEKSGHEDGGGEGSREGRGERGHEGSREGRGERGHEGGREGRGERGHEGGREGRGEGGERREGRREGGEGHEGREKGEHEGREGRGEGDDGNREGKTRMRKNQKHDHVYRNGAQLTLEYNPATQAFVGHVKNTTKLWLPQVRVEIHLSNGRELGPTKRINLAPGKTMAVELSALDQKFTAWVTHPEAGTEEGHEEGGEGSEGHAAREKGEHGAGGGDEGSGEHGGEGGEGEKGAERPASAFRPVENQLLLLRGEMRAFKADLKGKK